MRLGITLSAGSTKWTATLPYFIPMPIGLGTMGAFINMKGIPKNRDHLMDIGAAGPLAGFVVAVIVLIIGLRMSVIDIIPATFPTGYGAQIEGSSILYLLLKYLTFGRLAPPTRNVSPLALAVLAAIFLHRSARSLWRHGRDALPCRLGGLGGHPGHRA